MTLYQTLDSGTVDDTTSDTTPPDDTSTAVWSYKDIDNFYDRVRALLTTATTTTISNAQMDFPEKAPFAERVIKGKVSKWETYKEEDLDKFSLFESAIVYLTAIYFERYVIVKQPKKMQSSSLTIEYNTSSLSGDINSPLEDMLEDLLNDLKEDDYTTNYHAFIVT